VSEHIFHHTLLAAGAFFSSLRTSLEAHGYNVMTMQ